MPQVPGVNRLRINRSPPFLSLYICQHCLLSMKSYQISVLNTEVDSAFLPVHKSSQVYTCEIPAHTCIYRYMYTCAVHVIFFNPLLSPLPCCSITFLKMLYIACSVLVGALSCDITLCLYLHTNTCNLTFNYKHCIYLLISHHRNFSVNRLCTSFFSNTFYYTNEWVDSLIACTLFLYVCVFKTFITLLKNRFSSSTTTQECLLAHTFLFVVPTCVYSLPVSPFIVHTIIA